MAVRPKTLTAAAVPIVVATALVKAEGYPVLWWVSVCAAVSALFIQIGTNLVNDAIDFEKGADTAERIGFQRVTQSGLMSSRQVMTGAFVCFACALALGVPLVVRGGLPIVAIGLVSLALAYGYTGGPFPLAYNGLGDIVVILFFGFVAVGGTYYLHAQAVSPAALIAGLQVGLLAAVLIAINNLRDAPQDGRVNKKTLAVRFGVTFARLEILFLAVAPFVLGWYWYERGSEFAAVMPLLVLPVASRVIAGVFANEPSFVYNRFLAMAAALHLGFGILLAAALWVR